MTREFTFQDPGEGIHEGEIVEVRVSAGDEVDEGATILTVETDKATTEVPSPYSGRIESVEVASGDVVTVGDVLVTFADGRAGEPAGAPGAEEAEATGGEAAAVGELPGPEAPEARAEEAPREEPRRAPGGPVPASPATRRLARELDVDLDRVEPSGPEGRVLGADVRAAAEERPGAAPEAARLRRPSGREAEAPALPDFERWGPVERIRLRGVRRTTAQRMATSWAEIPHVTHHDVVDVTDLERFRRAQAPTIEGTGGQLTLTVLVMKALVGVLERHPRFNASLDADAGELVLKRYHHVGVAVDTDDGLIVPVVRDVDRKPLTELADETTRLVERTRQREITREELQGGTITITNVGPLGGTALTPLIRHPEVAIVGMARARLEPVVRGDLDDHDTEVRLLLPLSISFDHRVNDGADAARFTTDLGQALSDPESLLLSV